MSGGPFILFKYTAKQAALFKRNPDFYGPKPHINGLALEFYTNDDAMVAALKSGQLDGVRDRARTPRSRTSRRRVSS